MLLFSRPSESQVGRFLENARKSSFSYSETGATATTVPSSFAVDHSRIRLGFGPEVWSRAIEAVKTWKMFDMDWMRLYWPSTPIRPSENVAVVVNYLNCYWINACRIVYVTEEVPQECFGFAYGTLLEHAESGEERFSVNRDPLGEEVWYDILAFSRPNQFLSRVGYPLARKLQKRFAADSQAAMLRAVSEPAHLERSVG